MLDNLVILGLGLDGGGFVSFVTMLELWGKRDVD